MRTGSSSRTSLLVGIVNLIAYALVSHVHRVSRFVTLFHRAMTAKPVV